MSTDIAEADQAAADAAAAAAAVDQAEADLAAGRRGISASALHKLRDAYRHASLSAEGAKAKAERDREAARLAALGEIGRQVDELAAASVADELAGVFEAIADACARAWSIARTWDTSVHELIDAARDLGAAKEMPPGGPPKSAGHLAIRERAGDQAITHRRTQLAPVSTQLALAIERAVLGRPHDGLALVTGASELPEPRRPDTLARGGGGMLIPVFGEPNQQLQNQMRSGDVTVLPKSDVDAYMAGEPT
jgi:hypothetical protein